MEAKGLNTREAAASTRRWLLDYSELTASEREVFRNVFFFYQWPKKVLPRLMAGYFEKTRKMALLTRASTRPFGEERTDERVPDFLRRTAAVPFGQSAEGNQRFLLGTGTPLEELNRIDPTVAEGTDFWGKLKGVSLSLMRNLNPFLRTPIEYATGKDLFFNQPIIERTRADAAFRLPGLKQFVGAREDVRADGEKVLRGDPFALFFAKSSPAGRFIREGSEVANFFSGGTLDPNTTGAESLFRFLTGIRTAEIDDKQALRLERDAVQDALLRKTRTGEVGRFPGFFARDVDGEKDPGAQDLIRQVRELSAKLREDPDAAQQKKLEAIINQLRKVR